MTESDKIAVVLPTCRPDQLAHWYAQWEEQFDLHKPTVYIIHDALEVSKATLPAHHCCWADIDRDWADSALIFPHHTDGVRCYGFWLAVKQGADIVITLDDDVVPDGDSIGGHIQALTPVFSERWLYAASIRTRGLPYRDTTTVITPVISHGLWSGVPDLDAPSQLIQPDQTAKGIAGKVERGMYFPQSGMNLAFRKEILPVMFWPPMGPSLPYERFGDIWAGVISQCVCAHLGLPVMNAYSWVRHDRLSNVFFNLELEAPGIRENERFWRLVDSADLTGCHDAVGCIYALASHFRRQEDHYYHTLADWMERWNDQVACLMP